MKVLIEFISGLINRRLVSISLAILLIISWSNASLAIAGQVEWIEVPQSIEGRQWWDSGSLRQTKDGFRSVLTRFSAENLNEEDSKVTRLYVMEIECDQRLFRDVSINGLPRLNPKWENSGDDSLINSVIDEVCEVVMT